MAATVAKHGLGALIEKLNDGADLIIVLLKEAEANTTLADYDDLEELLDAVGNTEADFTNYERKAISNASIDVTYDSDNDRWDADFDDPVWTEAGNGTNNTLAKLLVCVDGASDADRLVGTIHDFIETTNGSDLRAVIPEQGLYRARQPA